MKKQIEQYLEPFKQEGEFSTETAPILSLKSKNKYLVGRLAKDKTQQPYLQVYYSNYSKPYARRMLKNRFQESGFTIQNVEMLSTLFPGDVIVSNEYVEPDADGYVELDYRFEFSGIYNQFIPCGSQTLGSNWHVRYNGFEELPCGQWAHLSTYHKYELIEEL